MELLTGKLRVALWAVLLCSPCVAAPSTRPSPASQPSAVEIERLRRQVAALALEVANLQKEVVAMRQLINAQAAPAPIAAAPPANLAPKAVDDKQAAANAGKVVVGQTMDQARVALDKNHWTTAIYRSEDYAGGKAIRREKWVVNENDRYAFRYPNKITIENDIVTHVE